MKIPSAPLITATLLALGMTFMPCKAFSAEVSARNTTSATQPVLDTGNVSYANAWRIIFDKQAESDGEITFRLILKDITDANIEATKISISIVKGTTKPELAKIIEGALKSRAPTGTKVERNADDEISISSAAGISVIIDANTIADLDVKLVKQKE